MLEERVLQDKRTLRVFVKSDTMFFRAELVDDQLNSVAKAPMLRIGGELACAFDLSALPPGRFRIWLRAASDTALLFGRVVAGRHQAAAVLRSDAKSARFIRIGEGTIPTGAHAWTYVDLRRGELYVWVSKDDDLDQLLARSDAGRVGAPVSELAFSVISAVFQVEKYLDDFFDSLITQSLDFRSHIEVIMVDDGSTDASPRIIKRWHRKYPDNIRYLFKPNGGPGSARNLGIVHASRDWVTFIDPDDFIDKGYFEQVLRSISSYDDLAMVSCNVVVYDEATRSKVDDHPLRFRFGAGERLVPANNLGRDLQLNASSVFFRRDIIAEGSLRFDERIRPGFEDAHFDARYLLAAGSRAVLFLPTAILYARRRADQSSLKQVGPFDPRRYDAQVRFGYIGLLREAAYRIGAIPTQIQHTVLYSLSWQFSQIVDQPASVAFLSTEQKRMYVELLREVFALIDRDAIESYDVVGLPFRHRVGILNLFKNLSPTAQHAEVRRVDRAKQLIELVFWSGDKEPDDTIFVDGRPIAPTYRKLRRCDFLGSVFSWEHIRWVRAGDAGTLGILIAKRATPIVVAARALGSLVSVREILQSLAVSAPQAADLPPFVRDIRRLASGLEAQAKYRGAWLFMDRDDAADDSAEHMYRFVREHRPELNIFFILQRGCPHWRRLESDGFRLIPFAEPDHAMALLNAIHLISSHAAHFVLDYLPSQYFGDLLNFRFTYLRHGVSKDLNGWLDSVPIDCLISSSQTEYDSITRDGSEYRYCAKEVVLTGLARHDVLLSQAAAEQDRTIVLMPTWRQSLAGPALGAGNKRSKTAAFYASEFANRWRSLLHSKRLAGIAKAAEYSLVFVPHENIEQYLEYFQLPKWIAVRRFRDAQSIQPLFARLSLFVTDYSSKAFDAALLRKPVLYYQFDREFFFGGEHGAQPGYFDYGRDGFGPVHVREETLLADIETAVGGAIADPVYQARAERFFAFRDGRNRERILNAILALDASPDDDKREIGQR